MSAEMTEWFEPNETILRDALKENPESMFYFGSHEDNGRPFWYIFKVQELVEDDRFDGVDLFNSDYTINGYNDDIGIEWSMDFSVLETADRFCVITKESDPEYFL